VKKMLRALQMISELIPGGKCAELSVTCN